ncbi:hypothetical protein BH10PLA1_BH10PLA1_16060 [soil metagenome]
MKNLCCLAVALVLGFSLSARAGSVGINFVGSDSEKSAMKPDDKAGAESATQANWNNVTVSNDDPNGHGNTGRKAVLHNEANKEAKNMSVLVKATGNTQIFPTDTVEWGFSEGNLKLMSGTVCPQPSIAINNIPYKHYDVYVYFTAGAQGGVGSATISLGKNAKGAIDDKSTYFYNVAWAEGAMVKSDFTTLDDAKAGGAGNFVRFRNNTAGSIVIDCDGKLGGGWTGCAAVQIVETPEVKPAKK